MNKQQGQSMPAPHQTHLAGTTQIGGTHYVDMEIQPWEAMEAWMTPDEFRGFLKGNVLKYLARERKKGRHDDLRKAHHYLTKLIEMGDSDV
jgi:hypothetical protein